MTQKFIIYVRVLDGKYIPRASRIALVNDGNFQEEDIQVYFIHVKSQLTVFENFSLSDKSPLCKITFTNTKVILSCSATIEVAYIEAK
jgi:hypothetical protein